MNLDIIVDYLPLYEKAAVLTLKIGLIGIGVAIIIGLIGSMVLHMKIKILRNIVRFYVEVSRNTPLMVQLFFIYYGLPKIVFKIDPFTCGIIGLGFLGGGYMTESFRGGLDSIDQIQKESAQCLGMNRIQTFIYVLIPQAVSVSVPSLISNIIFLLKETSVFSAISIMDLMFTAKDLIGLYYKTTEALFLLVIFYLIILLPISLMGTLLERRARYAGFGT